MKDKPPVASVSDVPKTDFLALLGEVSAGLLAKKLDMLNTAVPAALMHSESRKPKAKVVLEIDYRRVQGSETMMAAIITVKEIRPTLRGAKTETDTTEVVFHIGTGGKLTLLPDRQQPLFERQEPATPSD